ncbi:hypothetical protein M758_2G147700 [Ceratodon purpureus]|nr:hypothetical protein M758_2G147700 [Ceratodon purpureus]
MGICASTEQVCVSQNPRSRLALIPSHGTSINHLRAQDARYNALTCRELDQSSITVPSLTAVEVPLTGMIPPPGPNRIINFGAQQHQPNHISLESAAAAASNMAIMCRELAAWSS